MRTFRLAVLAILLASPWAMAQQDHTCQGGNNCNEGGGSNGTNNTSNSEAVGIGVGVSSSDADSRSSSYSSGGSVRSSVDVSGGQSDSRAQSAIGDISTSGGNATGGVGGDTSIQIDGDDHTAASAATVFAGHCQTGMSGQLEAGGFGVVNSDQFCDYIRLAAVMREAYDYEITQCQCVGVCTNTVASVEMSCPDGGEKASEYLAAYHWNLSEAQELVVRSEYTALADRWGGQLIRPMAVILSLIWIL
jgi:hypothetical protein